MVPREGREWELTGRLTEAGVRLVAAGVAGGEEGRRRVRGGRRRRRSRRLGGCSPARRLSVVDAVVDDGVLGRLGEGRQRRSPRWSTVAATTTLVNGASGEGGGAGEGRMVEWVSGEMGSRGRGVAPFIPGQTGRPVTARPSPTHRNRAWPGTARQGTITIPAVPSRPACCAPRPRHGPVSKRAGMLARLALWAAYFQPVI